ncbi:unnamed protein product [Phaedon cochleariae]|uniref:Centriolar and ciliogenesis-associated protein HYLS1 C-terminal domain-containing protein n=1 Tax=Phaedon cochleariae TaxID=80249 RepID=A0A9P0GIK5_PHACE|nr:unnamed protein product [Phaedon cochleariae]
MSHKINPREVLLYLNELGYTNVTAQQLKEFITDLKKLIKYEFRHGKIPKCMNTLPSPQPDTNNVDHFLDSKDLSSNSKHLTSETSNKQKYEEDIFHTLHNHHTVSSRTRTVNTKEKHISVHITQPRHKKIHEHCIHVERTCPLEKKTSTTLCSSETNIEESNKVDSSKTEVETGTADTIDCQPMSKQSVSCGTSASKSESKSKKSKSSVIRTSSSKTFNRCDPVALYHQYKEEWKKIKFPGLDHHSDLRWAVREKLMSGPPVQVPMRRSSSKKNFNDFNLF